ncbi:TadE/TadG family type IV pilus assembly protein [Nonomuraea sp. NPDC050310]|uniref:TadE/TadG family type IV pilus assembly protein n=1 Tax=unclassified Nonomuraea TaxID=2593643 RepID=UPI0033FECF73
MPRVRRGDRGASAIELAIIMPVVLIVLLLIVQFALIFHGRQVADAAAREGARVARSAGAGARDWQSTASRRAKDILRAMGPKMLESATVTPWQRGSERGVTVRGNAVAAVPLMPGMTFTITSTFGGPIECFRPDNGSGGCG